MVLPSGLLLPRAWRHLIKNICSFLRETSTSDSNLTVSKLWKSGVYIWWGVRIYIWSMDHCSAFARSVCSCRNYRT